MIKFCRFLLLFLALVHLTYGAIAQDIYQATGERFGSKEDGGYTLTGNASLTQEDYKIFAERIDWYPQTGFLTAGGEVLILRREAKLAGETLSLNLKQHTGDLRPARGAFQGYLLAADGLEMFPEKLVANRALLTTCDRERPHYGLEASKIIVLYSRQADGRPAPKELELQGGRLQYRGRSLLPFPKFRINLAGGADSDARTALPLPYPGYSSADGLLLGYHWSSGWQDRTKLSLDWRTTARRGMRAAGYLDYSLAGDDFLRLTISRREDLRDEYLGPRGLTGGFSNALVNREPEIAVSLAERPIASRINWQNSASYGYYRESPSGASDDRAAFSTGIRLGPFPAGRKLSFNAAAAYRQAAYGNSDNNRVLYRRLTARIKPQPDWQLDLSLVGRNFYGDSPFHFDRVDFSRELATELACPLGKNWRGKFLNRYDLQQQKTRDNGIALSYRAHCLDYSLSWRQNRDTFEFGISLAPEQTPSP